MKDSPQHIGIQTTELNHRESTARNETQTPTAQIDKDSTEIDIDNLDAVIPPHNNHTIPVVGIGGSAGAIQALREFFTNMPPDSGMIFVIVLHLSPEYKSNLAEVLQHSTQMPVIQVTQPVKVEKNHIYVIPPGKHLSMSDGQIHPLPIDQPRGKRVAIDLFFRTLADSHGTGSTGIILSGGDADGAIGLQRIKERGGLTIAQDPDEAEHDSMPRAAIATGMVDWILLVREMPAKLLNFLENERQMRLPAETTRRSQIEETESDLEYSNDEKQADENALREVLSLLRVHTGHDFSHYKRATILRRVGRRLQVNSISDIPSYLAFLRINPGEAGALLHDLLISVTNFFRDSEAFEALQQVIPALFKDKTGNDQVRVWIAGCASGDEAYSIGMMLMEYASQLEVPPSLLVFATDISDDAIQSAREGLYPETIAADVSPARLRRFFTHESGRYRVRKELREIILFASHNVLKDSPFSRVDLICCRNLLIYLKHEAQQRVFETFHFALRPQGFLFLGNSESAEDFTTLYAPQNKKHRIYTRRDTARSVVPPLPVPSPSNISFPHTFQGGGSVFSHRPHLSDAPSGNHHENIPERAPLSFGEMHLRLLEKFAPPSILVNENYDILHLSENAGRFLQFSGGQPSSNLLKVINPSLRLELNTALFTAAQKGIDVKINGIPVDIEGIARAVDLQVRPSHEIIAGRVTLLVVLQDSDLNTEKIAALAEKEPLARRLDEELQHVKANLRTSVEQYETSVEELKASNEELQAMNEEARSTTEELETSKEELQSVNEELVTVNQELKNNLEELKRSNTDLQNLIVSTDIGTIFLDRDLVIKRFTPRAAQLFNLIPTDVERPLSHLSHGLDYPELIEHAREVLAKLTVIENEVRSHDGRWHLARLLPYRTADDRIDGVVLTMLDITERKQQEISLRESEQQLRAVFAKAAVGLSKMDLAGRFQEANPELCRMLGLTRQKLLQMSFAEVTHPEDIPACVQAIDSVVATGETVSVEKRCLTAQGDMVWGRSTLTLITDDDNKPTSILAVTVDLSQRQQEEEELRTAKDKFETIARTTNDAVWEWEVATNAVIWHDGVYRLFGYRMDDIAPTIQWWLDHIHPDEREDVWKKLQATLTSSDLNWNAEYRFQRHDGGFSDVVHCGRFIGDKSAGDLCMVGGITDITDRKRSEKELRQSEERYRLLVEGTKDYAMFLMDQKRQIYHWNSGAERIFGFSREEMIGQSADLIFTPEDRANNVPEQEVYTARLQGRAADIRWHIRKGGSRFWADGIMTRLTDETGALQGYAKITRDATKEWESDESLRRAHEELERRVMERTEELQQTNEELRSESEHRRLLEVGRQRLMERIVSTQEEERRRIARELHDQMGQQLTALLMGLKALTVPEAPGIPPEVTERITSMQVLTTELMERAHDLAWELRPATLDNLGLEAAIRQYAHEWALRNEIALDFVVQGMKENYRGGQYLEAALYRVVQEALFNIQKHAAATNVSILLECVKDEVVVVVEDNGRGFEVDHYTTWFVDSFSNERANTGISKRLGLLGMKERMELVGGSLNIESSPGNGTTIYARCPLIQEPTEL